MPYDSCLRADAFAGVINEVNQFVKVLSFAQRRLLIESRGSRIYLVEISSSENRCERGVCIDFGGHVIVDCCCCESDNDPNSCLRLISSESIFEISWSGLKGDCLDALYESSSNAGMLSFESMIKRLPAFFMKWELQSMPADIIASKFLRWDTIVHLLSNGTIAIAGVSSQHVHFIHARNQDSSMFLRLFLGQDRPNNLGRVVCWSTAADRVLIVNEYGVLSGWVQDNKVFELSVINHDEKILDCEMKAVANLDTMIVGLNMSVQNYGAPKRKQLFLCVKEGVQVSFTLQELAREVLQRNLVHDLNVNDIDIVIVDIIFGRCSDWLILWSMRVHGNILGEDVMLRYGHVISSHSFVPYDNSVKSAVINAGYSVDQLNSLSASDGGGNYGPLSCFYDLGQKLMQESMFTCTVLTTAWKAYSGENIPISEARSCRSLIILHVIDRLKSSRLSADDESQSSNWKEAISSFLRCCREILFNSYLSGAMVLDMAQNCLLVGNLGSFAAVSLSELGTTRSVDSLSSIQRFMRSKFSSLFGCSGEHGFVQFVIGHFSDRTQYCIEIFISWTRLLLSDPEVPGALAACPRIPLSIFQKVIDRAASILSAPSPEDSLAGALLVNRLLDIMDDLAIAGIMVCSSQFLHGFSWQSVSDEMACLREMVEYLLQLIALYRLVLHLQGSKSNTGSYSEWHRFLTYIGSEQRTEVSSLRTDLTAFCAENSVLSASHADRWMTASVFNAHATVSKQKASVTRRRYLSGAFDCSSESQFSSTVVPSKPMWLLSSSHGSDDHVLLCSQMLLCHDCGISAEESIMDSSHGVLFPFKDLISAAQDRRAFSSRAFDQIKDWSSADVLSTIRLRAFGSLFSSAVKIGSAYLALMLYISGDMQNDTANYLSLRNLVAHQALYGRNPSAALALRALLDFDNTLLNPLQRDLLNDLIVKISNFGALYNISMLSHKLDSNENTFFDKTSEALVVAGQSAGIDNLVAVQILRGQWVAAAKSNINLLALQRQAATESHLYVMLRSLMKMMQQLDQRLFSSSQSSILGEKEINNVLLLKGVKVSPEWYLTRGLWTIFLAIEKSSLASAFSALPSSAHHSSMHFQSYSCVQNLTQMTSCALSGLAVCHLMWQQLNEGSDMYFSLLERLLRQFSSDLHTKILVQQAVNGIRYAKDAKRLLFLLLSFELYDEAEKCCSRLTQLPNSKEFVGLAMAAVADRSASFRVALTKVLTQY